MPCRDYSSDYDDNRNKYADRIQLELTIAEQKNRLDMLARIACEAMTMLQSTVDPELKNVTKEAKEWFVEHQIADKKEKQRIEKLKEKRKKLLNKKGLHSKSLHLKKLKP